MAPRLASPRPGPGDGGEPEGPESEIRAGCRLHSSVAYVLVDQEGTRRPVRCELSPEAGEHVLSDAEGEAAGPDHLMPECG